MVACPETTRTNALSVGYKPTGMLHRVDECGLECLQLIRNVTQQSLLFTHLHVLDEKRVSSKVGKRNVRQPEHPQGLRLESENSEKKADGDLEVAATRFVAAERNI